MPPRQLSLCWGFAVMIPDLVKMVGEKAFKPGDITGTRVHTIGQMVQTLVLAMFFVSTLRFMIISKRWLIHGECEEKNWRALGWVTVIIGGIMAVRQFFCAMLVCVMLIILQFRSLFAQVQSDSQQDHSGKSYYGSHEWVYWITQEIPVFSKPQICCILPRNSTLTCNLL